MKLFKLTDLNGFSRNSIKWGKNVTNSVPLRVKNPSLCSENVIHAYKNIHLAILLNPIHLTFADLIWEASGDVVCEDFGKVGCYEITTLKVLPFPEWTKTKKEDTQIMFAILCAETVLKNFEKLFPNDKRPRQAIEAARKYLLEKFKSAASAAYSAASAAYSAASARSSAVTAYSAAYSALCASYYNAAAGIDFCRLANQAVKLINGGKKNDLHWHRP